MDYSDLSSTPPQFKYDVLSIKETGHTTCFALDPRNEKYHKVISRCEEHKWPYLIKEGEGKQKHVWIKGWRDKKF